MDRVSRYRVIRLSVHLPSTEGGNARWAAIANKISNGIPTASIIGDGEIRGVSMLPTTEECFELFDAACRQAMLPR